jgi:hypothetical protein
MRRRPSARRRRPSLRTAHFPIERHRTDGAFDGVVVELDATIIDEARQALPARQRVADGVGEPALLADQGELCAQLALEGFRQRPALLCRMRCRSSVLRPRIS